MSAEVKRQECDVTVYRCDYTRDTDRCVRETASFQTQESVTVLLDPAWMTTRVSLGEEKHFCSWDHHLMWAITESAALERSEQSGVDPAPSDPGAFALRLRNAAQRREAQEAQEAVYLRDRIMRHDEAAALLGFSANA
jgi:hypothetical protein